MPAASTNELNGQSTGLRPGTILSDRYRVVRPLGKGGMGAVYEAVDQRLDSTVALKETLSVDGSLRRQFEQEARMLAKLHHPALPRVSDYFTEGKRAFLVMQFVSGIDLAEIIAKHPGRPFSQNQVIAWADQLLDALIYLHTRERQIVHRDIKPHNLKLTSTGRIALLDFGLAKTQSSDISTTNSSASVFGYTRRYSPLEQIQDRGTTPRSDLYALGATLYHLLTGIKPPDALVRAAALVESKNDPLRPANEIHPAVGAEIAAILNRAMAQNPEDRYADAGEFREALRQIGRTYPAVEADSRSKSEVSRDTTIVRTLPISGRDPFDAYSILRPDESLGLVPSKRQAPNIIVAILVLLLVAGLAGSYGYRRWFAEPDQTSDLTKTTSAQLTTGPSNARHAKLDKLRTAGMNNASATSSGEVHSNDAQKRLSLRKNSGEANVRKPSMSPSPAPRPRRVSADSRPTTTSR